MKTDGNDSGEIRKEFVQANPLDSKKALQNHSKYKPEPEGRDSPVIKSLFDVKENQQFKVASNKKKSGGRKSSTQ